MTLEGFEDTVLRLVRYAGAEVHDPQFVFLKGFREAIGIAVVLVATYLLLNVVVLAGSAWRILTHPVRIGDWTDAMPLEHSSPLAMIDVALLVFPKLALGMSGSETGVAVMPQVRGDATDTYENPAGRIRGTRKLLTTAAVIMNCFLLHYLPRYGMAPEWTRAVRPLVLVFMAIAVFITIWFNANVDDQSGAYATGVLVLMLSASFASAVAVQRRGNRWAMIGFGAITAVFAYTLVTNVVERPDGIKIASLFIIAILLTLSASRIHRAFELRAAAVTFDENAVRLIDEAAAAGPLRIIANEPQEHSTVACRAKEYSQREQTHIPDGRPVLFLEVFIQDSSDFTATVAVHGDERHGVRRLRMESAVVPNTIAAVLMELRDRTGQVPHAYFNWTEGHPVSHLLRLLVFGDGEVAPVTREVLRRAEPEPALRPRVHVG